MSINRRKLMRSGGMGAALLAMGAGCAKPDQAGSDEMAHWDAVETAARISKGEVSAAEVVAAAIKRAKRIEPKLNAIVTKTYSRAREAAEAATGPWAGVPTFVKDLDDVAGVASAFGSRAFPGYNAKEQTPLINKFLDLGVVSLGKSSTPEFGLSASTEPLSSGKTRNPWNTDYSTGGSSGGAAALVAGGVVPIAHASDGGGSIRIPSSCCGNVGLKVSRGRNPLSRPDTVVGPISLSVHGAQTRTVRDTAAVAAALALPASESGLAPLDLVTGPDARRLKIGLALDGLGGVAPSPEVRDATNKVAAVCEGLGHQVEALRFPVKPELELDFRLYWAAFAHSAVTFWEKSTNLPRNGLAFEPFTLGLVEYFEAHKDGFDDSIARLQAVNGDMASVYAKHDVMLSPVLSTPPPKIGYLGGNVKYELLMERLNDYVQYTALYNITGDPAISLPLSMSPDGLPIGAMFGAALGQEAMLLGLSYELEEAMAWSDRRPTIFG